MTGRKKFILSVISILLIFAIFILVQVIILFTTHSNVRSSESLINQYYRLSDRDPEGAKRALELILQHDSTNLIALRELGFWYLRQGNTKLALKQFEYAQKIYPSDTVISDQLNLLYAMIGQSNKTSAMTNQTAVSSITMSQANLNDVNYQDYFDAVKHRFTQSLKLADNLITNEAIVSVVSAKSVLKPVVGMNLGVMTERDKLLNEFYQNKKTNSKAAWGAMNKLLDKYPNDVIALKEAGYFALSENKKELSVSYFERAYHLTNDPYLALQCGYILDGLNHKRLAYYYFDLATHTNDLSERMKAELAKTNLRGVQTKFLPAPYFANILFYPFYQSRFKLIIYPVIARVGVVLNQKYNLIVYTIYRRTSDNKSNGSGQLPQIYEDNAAITSLGMQVTPFPKIPFNAFIEGGKSVDLVYRNRARWRNDFRYGFLYYNEWGKYARYTFKPTFSATPNIDICGDLIYYSRYLNTIATLRFRPGLEIFRFGSTSLNFYIKGFLSQDQSRLFYNNIFEYGPSLAFTPSDRYNFTIRYECLKGVYLRASSQGTPNPYSNTYHNNMIFLDTYVGF